jgi:hypothetical protein
MARKLEEQVLEGRRRILGEEHANTSLTEWNYLGTVPDLGDNQSATSLVEKLSWY